MITALVITIAIAWALLAAMIVIQNSAAIDRDQYKEWFNDEAKKRSNLEDQLYHAKVALTHTTRERDDARDTSRRASQEISELNAQKNGLRQKLRDLAKRANVAAAEAP